MRCAKISCESELCSGGKRPSVISKKKIAKRRTQNEEFPARVQPVSRAYPKRPSEGWDTERPHILQTRTRGTVTRKQKIQSVTLQPFSTKLQANKN